MPLTFLDYLKDEQSAGPKPLTFLDYIDQPKADTGLKPLTFLDYIEQDPLEDYSSQLESLSKSVVPTEDEMEEQRTLGFGGALWSGLKAGLTLGYARDEDADREAMTFGEEAAELLGEFTGGLIPLGIASAVTGGAAAPAVAATRMKRAYDLIRRMGRAKKSVDKLQKSYKTLKATKDVTNISAHAKRLDTLENRMRHLGEIQKSDLTKLGKLQKEHLDDLIAAGAPKRTQRAVAKAGIGIAPQVSGLLGKRKFYQKGIKLAAEKYGFQAANWMNRFANSATSFASVGLVSSKPGYSILDRAADIPKDVAMGGFFALAGLPTMVGMKGAKAIEPAALMAIGAGSDYITASPNPDMDIRDRILHGMMLTGFHYVGMGLSNKAVKEKTYNGLRAIGFDKPVAYELSYNSKFTDNMVLGQSRQWWKKHGFVYRNRKNPDEYVSIAEMTGKVGETDMPVVVAVPLDGGTPKPYKAETLGKAKRAFDKEYERFDPTKKEFIDDAPSYIKENVEVMANLRESEIIGRDIPKQLSKDMVEAKERINSQIKELEAIKEMERRYELEKVESGDYMPDKKKVYDLRKDEETFLKTHKKAIKDLDINDLRNDETWPAHLEWMNKEERKLIREQIDIGDLGENVSEPSRGYVPATPDTIRRKDIKDLKPSGIQNTKDLDYHLKKIFGRSDNVPYERPYYSIGDYIIIPKLNQLLKEGEASWNNEVGQLAEVVGTYSPDGRPIGHKARGGDSYVKVPDESTIRIKTVMLDPESPLYNQEVVLNIRLRSNSKESIKNYNEKGDAGADYSWKDRAYQDKEAREDGPVPTSIIRDDPIPTGNLFEFNFKERTGERDKPWKDIEKVELVDDPALLESLGVPGKYAGKTVKITKDGVVSQGAWERSSDSKVDIVLPSKKIEYEIREKEGAVFRRGDRFFNAEGREVPVSDISGEQTFTQWSRENLSNILSPEEQSVLKELERIELRPKKTTEERKILYTESDKFDRQIPPGKDVGDVKRTTKVSRLSAEDAALRRELRKQKELIDEKIRIAWESELGQPSQTGERPFTVHKNTGQYYEWLAKITGEYDRIKALEDKIRSGEYQELSISDMPKNTKDFKMEILYPERTSPSNYTDMFYDAKYLSEGKTEPYFWKPKLIGRERGAPIADEKTIRQEDLLRDPVRGKPEKEWMFDDPYEATNAMEKMWRSGEQSSIDWFDSRVSHFKNQEAKINTRTDYADFNNTKKTLTNLLKKKNYDKWEQKAVVGLLYPQAVEGKKINYDLLSKKEIQRAIDFLKQEESPDVYANNLGTLVPRDFSSKIDKGWSRVVNAVRRHSLPVATVLETLGNYGHAVSQAMKKHSKWRNATMGTVVAFEKHMGRELKGTGLNEVNQHIQSIRDKKYSVQTQSKEYQEFEKRMKKRKYDGESEGLDGKKYDTMFDFIEGEYQRFYDEMAKSMVSSNSWIKTLAMGKNKQLSVRHKKFVTILDGKGNEIKLADINKNPEMHIRQVDSFIDFLRGEGTVRRVINNKGDAVLASYKKSKKASFYEKDYSPRIVTERFTELAGLEGDKYIEKAIDDLIEASPELKDLKTSKLKKRDIARNQLNEIMNMRGAKGVYGRQWRRVADLPPYYYVERLSGDNVRIINIKSDNNYASHFKDGKPYKAGEKIIDSAGVKRTIDEVVPVYETNYNEVLKRYSDGVSHSTATSYAYGTGVTPDIRVDGMANRVQLQTGDVEYGKFAKKAMESQIFGEERTMADNILRPITRWSALAGLSFPTSGVKNVLLGNVQNATVFTRKELLRTIRHLMSEGAFKDEKAMAEKIGATYTGAYDLFLTETPWAVGSVGMRIAENAGLMKTTERFNRLFSQAIGPFGLKIHVENAAGLKNPATRGISEGTSRRILTDVFEFDGTQIRRMIERAARNDRAVLDGNEILQARQQAHLVTQGSADLPYVPLWMGRQSLKPLTLFYRIAYRMTDTVAKNVIKPIIADGNMIPAMKYLTFTTGSGFALYSLYDWVLDEDRANIFKDTPSHLLDYFLKAEGLAIFSNAFDEHGGVVDSYTPVIYRNTKSFIDNTYAFATGKKNFVQAGGDGLKEIVAAYGGYQRAWGRITASTDKRVKESRRRQTQFLDAFYPKEPLDIDYDNGITAKTAYYRALRDVFWTDDPKRRARSYYAALSYLKHRLMAENGYREGVAEKEARSRLKRSISRIRPVPSSWRKKRGRTLRSKYHEYYSRLPDDIKGEEDALDSLYLVKKRELYKAISDYRKLYYKRG